ncbi:MAG: Amuc_1100 family pilus-like protein [Verrucomicrobiota bacterium]
MNWFRENRFLGSFLVVFGLCTLIALWFLFSSKGSFDAASDQLNTTVTEFNRLQGLNPFPNSANVSKIKAQSKEAAAALEKLKQDLKTRVLPETPMAPNEFQARLRQVLASVTDKARANKVKLPENFFLGFDEYSAALPAETEAQLLGQQLAQIELLLNILIDARIGELTAFRRVPVSEQIKPVSTATPAPSGNRKPATTPTPGPKLIERSVVELTVVSAPGPARRAINQIASANQQFFVIRTLHVQNDKDKGPSRAQTVEAAASSASPPATAASPGAKPAASPALNFIVGTERIETTANIELIKFNL